MKSKVDDSVARRAIAFVRTVANKCSTCHKKNTENCRKCLAAWANEIMRDYERSLSESGDCEIDYSLAGRMAKIVSEIANAGRPLRSREIDMNDVCTFQLKWWTLRRMVRAGMIVRDRVSTGGMHEEWVYSLPR